MLSNVFLHLHPAKINRDAVAYNYTWGMGGMTFYLYITLVFTGMLLMFYYHPSKVVAFRDILYLESDVPFGKLLRNMHRWGAHLMVIMVELHMFRVFLTGSYKKPREFNWVVGVLLLVLTLLLSFTGYLLPDDQLGFWAVTVGTNMARATPLLGHDGPFGAQLGMTPFNDVRFGLLGGSIVDSNALLRAYIWHCVAIPIIASAFMVVHFWRVRKDGGISGPAPVMLEAKSRSQEGMICQAMRRQVSEPAPAVSEVSMDLHQLWTILSTPDNVPIVLLLFVVPFYTWYGLRQAFANDRLIAQLEADPALAKTHHRKTQPWKPGWAQGSARLALPAAHRVSGRHHRTVILMVWSITLNAPLEEPANPTLTMNPSKAPWYFLGLQEMLVYFDPWMAGVVMPSLIIVGLMVIPYIDTNPLGNGYYTYKQRKFSIWTFIFGFIVLWVSMIVIGTLIRGPGWMWFWPGTTWDHNRLIFEVNRDLPDIFGITGRAGKIIFGAIVIGAYCVARGDPDPQAHHVDAVQPEDLLPDERAAVHHDAGFSGDHAVAAGEDSGAADVPD